MTVQASFEGLDNSVAGTENRLVLNTWHHDVLTGTFLPLRITATSVSEKMRLLESLAALK